MTFDEWAARFDGVNASVLSRVEYITAKMAWDAATAAERERTAAEFDRLRAELLRRADPLSRACVEWGRKTAAASDTQTDAIPPTVGEETRGRT